MIAVNNPVRSGLVERIAHPGGNATAPTSTQPKRPEKRLQLLQEALPHVTRVGMIWDPDHPTNRADGLPSRPPPTAWACVWNREWVELPP